MFSYKFILQSLISVPKSLYTAATVNSFKLPGHTCSNLHNVPCVENCKIGTIKNIFNNTGVGRKNEVSAKYCCFSIPLDVYKKVRKVNHNFQVTKNIHQRSKTNILQPKSRIFHQDIRKCLTIRSVNRICKHRPQILQNTVRFISNRNSILPPPCSSDNSKIKDVPVNSDEIPSYKINIKFNGGVPSPIICNGNLIRNQSKDSAESSFNITMSKGRKIRPPSGTEKRCMNSGRIIKGSRKFIDYSLLKKRESLLNFFKFSIHTTQSLTDVKKSKSVINLKNLSIPTGEENIYYNQQFHNQSSSYPFYNRNKNNNNYKIDYRRKAELKKNIRFTNANLRPMNSTPRKFKFRSLNSSFPRIYNLNAKNNLLPTLVKQNSIQNVQVDNNLNISVSKGTQNGFPKAQLKPVNIPPPTSKKLNTSFAPAYNLQVMKDLLVRNKRLAEKAQLENNPVPLNFNVATLKKGIHEQMQENASRCNSYNFNKQHKYYMIDDEMINENGNGNQKSYLPAFNCNDGNTNVGSNNSIYTETNDEYTEGVNNNNNNNNNNIIGKAVNNYKIDVDALSNAKNIINKNNLLNTEDQENNLCNETSNTLTSSQAINSNNTDAFSSEEKQDNKSNTQGSNIYNSNNINNNNHLERMWFKNNSLSKNNDTTQIKIYPPKSGISNILNRRAMNRNMYPVGENQENKYNFQVSNKNYEMSTERNDSDVNKIHDTNQVDKEDFHTFSNINTEKNDNNLYKISENQENTSDIDENSNVDKISEHQENKMNREAFNTSNLDENSNVDKMSENQENKGNFQASTNRCNSLYGLNENQESNANFLASNMSNVPPTERSDDNNNVDKIDHRENEINFIALANKTNDAAPVVLNYNNNLSTIKKSPINEYFRTSNFINSDIPEPFNDNLPKYYGGDKVNMQTASKMNNMMETMNNNFPKSEKKHFNGINKIESNSFNKEPYDRLMTSQNNMHTGMTNESRMNIPVNMASDIHKKDTEKSLAELVQAFKQASVFVPRSNLWKKFKFPAPSQSTNYQYNDTSTSKPIENENEHKFPLFNSFIDARNYFVEPENLKKLSPAQIAMYNSIIYYENLIKKHSDEINRQRNNLESTQQALKIRKHKFYKNKSNFNETI